MHPNPSNLRTRATAITGGLLLFVVGSLLFSGVTGSVHIPLSDIPGALGELWNGKADSMAATLLDLRGSRALTACVATTVGSESPPPSPVLQRSNADTLFSMPVRRGKPIRSASATSS